MILYVQKVKETYDYFNYRRCDRGVFLGLHLDICSVSFLQVVSLLTRDKVGLGVSHASAFIKLSW